MKIAIVGSREINPSFEFIDKIITEINKDKEEVTIISGGAYGVDKHAANYAKIKKFKLIEFLPDWNKYGKSAGYIRNKEIVKNADYVVAIWNGKSRGTLHSINIAKEFKIPIRVINV